jgi:hypothetical protein
LSELENKFDWLGGREKHTEEGNACRGFPVGQLPARRAAYGGRFFRCASCELGVSQLGDRPANVLEVVCGLREGRKVLQDPEFVHVHATPPAFHRARYPITSQASDDRHQRAKIVQLEASLQKKKNEVAANNLEMSAPKQRG